MKSRLAGIQLYPEDAAWEVKRRSDWVFFDRRKGPWLYVEPVLPDGLPDLAEMLGRWVHHEDDANFEVMGSNASVERLSAAKCAPTPSYPALERDDMLPRIVCQFSCGAASAVATKLALAKYSGTHDVQIINAYIEQEHPDNRRFLADCEQWFERHVTVLRDERYGASVTAVFRRERFMKGRSGAPCTRLLKRGLLDKWRQPGDVMVFGYTIEELDRLEDFRERNPERPVLAPLIDAGLGKNDCKAMVQRAGIELPLMYRLGYDNANCIGCVKGGEGYMRAIAQDFPEQFEELCRVQDEIGPGAYLYRNRKTGERYGLRDIPPGPVRRNEGIPSCSFFCEIAEQEYAA